MMQNDEAWALVVQCEPKLSRECFNVMRRRLTLKGAGHHSSSHMPWPMWLDLEDFVSEARVKLFNSVLRYDPARSPSNSPLLYALSMCRFAASGSVYLAVNGKESSVHRVISGLNLADEHFKRVNKRSPTDQEVVETAYSCGIRPETSVRFRVVDVDLWRTTGDPWEDLSESAPGLSIADASPSDVDLQGLVIDKCMYSTAIGIVNQLNDRDRYVVVSIIHDGRRLADLGCEFGVSRERIRQIYRQALLEVRNRLAKLEKGCLVKSLRAAAVGRRARLHLLWNPPQTP
jgi:hypothetical protein